MKTDPVIVFQNRENINKKRQEYVLGDAQAEAHITMAVLSPSHDDQAPQRPIYSDLAQATGFPSSPGYGQSLGKADTGTSLAALTQSVTAIQSLPTGALGRQGLRPPRTKSALTSGGAARRNQNKTHRNSKKELAPGSSARNEVASTTKQPDDIEKMQLHMKRFEVDKSQRQAGNAKTGAVITSKTALENPKATNTTTGASQL